MRLKTSVATGKQVTEHTQLPEDIKIKYNTTAPRLTHPPYSFSTYQGTYSPSSYGEIEQRGVNGMFYPVTSNVIKGDTCSHASLPNCGEVDWRA